MRVWIETQKTGSEIDGWRVTLRVRVWIETFLSSFSTTKSESPSA